ncbi:MAG: terminase large subunit, partial [Chloroflexi bacterium]|nr:terminase large subunit [Chloroflexota bacterium]
EIDPATGLPAYRDVVVTVPRQSGKTTLVLAWELQRALGWGSPQRIVYSAQTAKDAREKLLDDQVPILEPRRKEFGIRQIRRANGAEEVVFVSGSRIKLLTSSEDSGHGKTVDMAVLDELFADDDDRREQALIPAMATRAAGQVLTTSTMGTDASMPLNRAVDRGRIAVNEGRRSGVAYFEWSAAADDDPDDPDVWWQCMPALGHTINEEVVRQAREKLPPGEFRRAFLNQQTKADERIISGHAWKQVCDERAAPQAPLTFAVDVNPERSAAAIVAAAQGPVAELVDYRPGTGWLVGRVVELNGRHNPSGVMRGRGPATTRRWMCVRWWR